MHVTGTGQEIHRAMNHPFRHPVFSWTRIAVLLLVGTTTPSFASAQSSPDSVRAEVARLAALVDSLSQEVARLQEKGQEEGATDALADLRAAAAAAAAAGGAPSTTQDENQEFVGRQRSLQALNPEISVNSDVFAHINKDDTDEDNFFAREFEISIISNLDPYSRAKVFLSRHVEGGEFSPFADGDHGHGHGEEEGGGGGFAAEEGYIEWVSLPGGTSLKVGKFFQQFGQMNRWHAHALPFQTRSLPHIAFVGAESLAQTGASMHWLAPFSPLGGTYEATVELTRSENETLFGESGRLSMLTHLNGFWNLSSSVDFDLGVSWLNGSYEDEEHFMDRNLYGMEAALNWNPPGQSRYRGLMLRGGVMALEGLVGHEDHEGHDDGEGEDDHEDEGLEQAIGYWGLGEVRLSQNWLVGARFDRTENPEDPTETAWLFSPTLTWWQSEYVRLRAEYDLVGRSFETAREGRLLFQVTFAMGPHKHETY